MNRDLKEGLPVGGEKWDEIRIKYNGVYSMIKNIKKQANIIWTTLSGMLLPDTWQQLTPCDVLLFRHELNSGYTFQGKVYSRLIDSIGDVCAKRGLTVQTVALPNSKLVGVKAYNSPVSCSRSYNVISIFGRLVKFVQGSEIGTEWIRSHHLNLWCNILDKATPKVIIGIQPEKYLCEAGRLKDIPVYDLQHGVIADEHPWYGAKYRIQTPIEQLPTGFLCWDDQSVATISSWAIKKGIRVIKIGNPWFLRFFRSEPDDILVQEAITTVRIIDDDRPSILVTLEWGIEDNFPEKIFNGVMVSALEKVIIDTAETYHWILRLHPLQLWSSERSNKEKVLQYLITTFGAEKTHKWVVDSEIPLPIVLRKADLHLTYSSSVVIEAAWMGVRSGILNQHIANGSALEGYYYYERDIGMAEVLPQDPDVIKQWIIDTLAKGRVESTLDYSGKVQDAFIEEIVERCQKIKKI